jgi:hypothetical protein
MNFLKHVGKHSDRKVCVLFRQVPGDDHMCLVIYPEVLPAPWHDAIMKVLESEMGQQAEQFADALHRSLLPDGRAILETLHIERMIKKVRTADVVITPRANAKIRLDELNTMLNEMKTGEDAIKRLAENDNARGMVGPEVKRAAEAAYKKGREAAWGQTETAQAPADGALSDRAIAENMLAQARKMETEANGLIAEAARMKKEAAKMDPRVAAPAKTPRTKGAKKVAATA